MSDLQTVATIDLGGTHLRAALVGEAAHILAQRRIKTPASEGPARVVEAMFELVRELSWETGQDPVAICVAAPGPLDPKSGIVHAAPNLPGWEGFPLTDALERALGIPARAHNDASLAGLGEAIHGAGAGADHVIYLTVSTGVGGGIVELGRMVGGSNGLAGELGHVIVQAGGPRCGFGHAGCLEALASGTAVAQAARQALIAHPQQAANSVLNETGELDARRVADAARDGDYLAMAVMADASEALGLAIGGYVNAFDPDVVVIGGGLGLGAWDLLERPLRHHASRVVMSPRARSWKLVSATLGDDAGLVGAAEWLRRQ